MKGWYNTAQVARRFGVKPVTVQAWLARGLFPDAEKSGRDWHIPDYAVEAFTPPTPGHPPVWAGDMPPPPGQPDRPTIDEYIENLRAALRGHETFFPVNLQERRRANISLAHDIGAGLTDYPPDQVKRVLGTLYGKLLVANSLDSVGVALSHKEWLKALREGAARVTEKRPT